MPWNGFVGLYRHICIDKEMSKCMNDRVIGSNLQGFTNLHDFLGWKMDSGRGGGEREGQDRGSVERAQEM